MIYPNGTSALSDILDVGTRIESRGIKMVGYKTLHDLTTLCGLNSLEILQLQERITQRGHHVLTLPKGEEEKPWAIYAYDSAALHSYLSNNSRVLRAHAWPEDPHDFVCRLALDWVHYESALRPLIDIAFGNFSREPSRSDITIPFVSYQPTIVYR